MTPGQTTPITPAVWPDDVLDVAYGKVTIVGYYKGEILARIGVGRPTGNACLFPVTGVVWGPNRPEWMVS